MLGLDESRTANRTAQRQYVIMLSIDVLPRNNMPHIAPAAIDRALHAYTTTITNLRTQGVRNEGNLRAAFAALLRDLAKVAKWTLIEEYAQRIGTKSIYYDGVLCDERLDDGQHVLLLCTRKLADLLEQSACFAGRSTLPGGLFFDAEQLLDGYIDDFRQTANLFWTQRHRVAFPGGIAGLRDAELGRDFRLRQSQRQACREGALAECGPWPFGWSASWLHGLIIRHGKWIYRKCLH